MQFVIRTSVNNELMSINKRIIVFKRREAKWFLVGGGFPKWKIEKFNKQYNPTLHIMFEEWIGRDTLKGKSFPKSMRIA